MPKTGIRSYETKTKGLRWLAYYHRDGRQVLKRGFRTSRQAERWRFEALTRISSPADSTITVAEWMEEWLERHKGRIKPSTYTRYDVALRIWVLPHLGLVRLAALTHRHIEAMHDAAVQAGRSPSTIRQNHAPLRIALQDALRDGLIPHNPAVLVRLPPMQKVEINPFTPIEAQVFLSSNRLHRFHSIYHLALSSGLRLGEILALRVGRDIDLSTRTIAVQGTRSPRAIGPPKSRQSNRHVVLDEEAASVLARAMEGKQWGELAFPETQYAVTQSMGTACRAASVKRVRFHDLRHTHATFLLASGANIRAVSARLGHASAAFTLQAYGHVLPGMDATLAEATGRILQVDSINTLSQPLPQNGHEP